MKKSGSFARPLANRSIPGLGLPEDSESKRTPEDPSVFGGRASLLPEGAVVEWLPDGRPKVVEESNE